LTGNAGYIRGRNGKNDSNLGNTLTDSSLLSRVTIVVKMEGNNSTVVTYLVMVEQDRLVLFNNNEHKPMLLSVGVRKELPVTCSIGDLRLD
jgi:hypothetical protein